MGPSRVGKDGLSVFSQALQPQRIDRKCSPYSSSRPSEPAKIPPALRRRTRRLGEDTESERDLTICPPDPGRPATGRLHRARGLPSSPLAISQYLPVEEERDQFDFLGLVLKASRPSG